MEVRILGWPGDEVDVELDRDRFAYAGKIGLQGTGVAVMTEADVRVGAVSFDRDRTAPDQWWIRYVTIGRDRRGEGLGAILLRSIGDRLLDGGTAVRIAVNNPFAYEAAYKAGFGYLGETVGLGELVLERPSTRGRGEYIKGLETFQSRSLSGNEVDFVGRKRTAGPPAVVRDPPGAIAPRDEPG